MSLHVSECTKNSNCYCQTIKSLNFSLFEISTKTNTLFDDGEDYTRLKKEFSAQKIMNFVDEIMESKLRTN